MKVTTPDRNAVRRNVIKDHAFLTMFAALSILSMIGWLSAIAWITVKLVELFV
jgi:hypothetical protein